MSSRRNVVYHLELIERPTTRPNNTAPQQVFQEADPGNASSHSYPAPTRHSGRVVDGFVLTMKAWFDRWLIKSFRARASGQGSSRPCIPCDQRLSQKQPETNLKKRPRENQSSGESDSESGDDGNGQGPQRKRASRGAVKATNFGCPFFKHNPTVHQRFQACYRPGFPTVHRLK